LAPKKLEKIFKKIVLQFGIGQATHGSVAGSKPVAGALAGSLII
jgi:hypothetical protein